MATLLLRETDTVRTQILSVESAPDFRLLPILKSTEVGLPEGLRFTDDNGDPLVDVKRCDIYVDGELVKDGGFCASVQTFVTTLEQVKANKVNGFESQAENDIEAISELDDDIAEQKQAIKDKLSIKLEAVESAVTLDEAEVVVWVDKVESQVE